MPVTDQESREELRYALRRYLAARPTAALSLDMIRHGLAAKGVAADDASILDQLAYWNGTEPVQVKMIKPHKHGQAKAWQITSAGVLAEESGE